MLASRQPPRAAVGVYSPGQVARVQHFNLLAGPLTVVPSLLKAQHMPAQGPPVPSEV